ncbi:hypothetical protein c7_R1271 [Megavirus courdo7]|uniref:Uncharacterized protein n=1 Tax=Megavirus courdo7 TaxID=1128135 RepID=H2ECL0_9VIRU|nr:hypothetical protein c7_R1271 [Megavirus courdo7]
MFGILIKIDKKIIYKNNYLFIH